METEVQTIMTPNGEELVILSRSDYEALLSAAQDADDRAARPTFGSRGPALEPRSWFDPNLRFKATTTRVAAPTTARA